MSLKKEIRQTLSDSAGATAQFREILEKKYLLRQWYEMIYGFVKENAKRGETHIELGSGSSFLKNHIPGLVKTNVIPVPENDLVFEAAQMPFSPSSVDNIILISVLHHLSEPERFFQEAEQALKAGGRIIISDPHVSLLSYIPWHFLHPEDCDLSRIGFEVGSDPSMPLRDANSATATLMFGRKNKQPHTGVENLRVITIEYHSIFHYWLAGGYNLPPLVPKQCLSLIRIIEKLLKPFGRFLASFMFVVLEKT